jgi:hypothetical protein
LASCKSRVNSNIYEIKVSKEVAEEAIKIVSSSEYSGSSSYSMDTCKMTYSNKLCGLLLIVSRLLRPFWLRNVFENDGSMMNTWSEEVLINSFKPLESLYYFIEKEIKSESKYIPSNKIVAPTKITKHDQYTLARYTRMKEFQTLQELKLLMEKSFHAFSLISFLYDININEIFKQEFSDKFDLNLIGVTFQGMVVSQHRHDQLKILLSKYLRESIMSNDDFEKNTDTLKKKSSFYYSLGDHNICKTLRSLLKKNYDNFKYLLAYSEKYMIQREDIILPSPYESNLEISCQILSEIACTENLNISNQSLCCLTELCLKVANNFLNNQQDNELYQRRNLTDNIKLITNQYCYRLLLKYLNLLVNSKDSINKIVSYSVDNNYLALEFCKGLYNGQADNWKDKLIQIREVFVEDYLANTDSQLLHKYYEVHKEFEKAADFAFRIATKDDDFNIDQRILFLKLSCDSIQKACDKNDQLEWKKIFYFNKLITAKLQKDIYIVLNGIYDNNKDKLLQDQLLKLEEIFRRLLLSLFSSSDLLHKIALPYNLWEYCLQLLNTDDLIVDRDPIFITTLWKSYIFKMIPQKAKTIIGKDFLKFKRNFSLLITEKPVLQSYFEDDIYVWTTNMIKSIVDLGKKIYTTNYYNNNKIDFKIDDINEYGCSQFVLPIDVIMEELITIVISIHTVSDNTAYPPRDWVSDSLKDIGIPIDIKISFFIRLSYTWIGQNFDKHLQIASSISKELINWIESSKQENE